jgi:hypothetical protein
VLSERARGKSWSKAHRHGRHPGHRQHCCGSRCQRCCGVSTRLCAAGCDLVYSSASERRLSRLIAPAQLHHRCRTWSERTMSPSLPTSATSDHERQTSYCLFPPFCLLSAVGHFRAAEAGDLRLKDFIRCIVHRQTVIRYQERNRWCNFAQPGSRHTTALRTDHVGRFAPTIASFAQPSSPSVHISHDLM